ncbi:MAG TPA: 30S ribosomal protein S27ae [Candidatus Krumholzibacteriaceae bacterium]|nr:30S ribosomal protein S27ae [Candidatus Krumholzibacteriaceae bacterium]
MPKEEKAKEKKEEKPTEKAPAKATKEEAPKAPAVKETEAAPEEVKEVKKAPKGKVPKKKKVNKKIHTVYKIEGTTITRQRPFCERCGPGYFMADHGNRYACGHCGFTRYKITEPAQVS